MLGVIDRADAPVANNNRPTNRDGEVSALAASLHAVWDSIQESRAKILRKTTLALLVETGQGLQYVI